MKEPLLRIEEVSKHFGRAYAVDGVSLEVERGGICGLVGPNGSGKTTLFNTILGLYHPNGGAVYFNGKCINNMSPHQIHSRGLVNAFQIPRLFPSLSVLDNMLVAARGQKGDRFLHSLFLRRGWQEQEKGLARESMEILEFVGLGELYSSPAGELSGGQRKLLEVARGLMARPELLLLDEPAAGVNPVMGKMMFQKLEELSRNGTTFFVVEHRLEILFEFARWVYVMDQGKVVARGHPQEVADDPAFYQAYLGEG
jgi:branched-chain amino acid transport system ATP-binding protein